VEVGEGQVEVDGGEFRSSQNLGTSCLVSQSMEGELDRNAIKKRELC
jgi:hypothetical protein